MKENLTRSLGRVTSTFTSFTAGQKAVSLVGTGALLIAGFMVFNWASAPSYAPLFSNLASEDASAIISELDAQGIPYELSNGGNTIMVPTEQVYATRINLSGEGLPGSSEKGYSLLDNQSLSTSQFQEQTTFKRAMEGELENTIEAIDGVDAAVVHLAMPAKQVFADEQEPTTASVLVGTRAGSTLAPEQVQAITNLVSSSVDGLDPANVTIADSTGRVLSAPGGVAGSTQTQDQQVIDFQTRLTTQTQAMLDRVLGVGNSTVQITPVLSFDKSVSETTRYFGNDDLKLSETESSESLQGTDPNGTTPGGVVGPDGQMDPTTTTGSDSSYEKGSSASDNAVNKEVVHNEAAPGGVESLHVGVVIDTRALNGADVNTVQNLVASALGVDPSRGDTIDVSAMAFDRTAETAAMAELEASTKAEEQAATESLIRNGGIAGVVALMLLIGWFRSRKRAKARAEATSYVVEQLRRDAADRAAAQAAIEAATAPAPAMLALEAVEADANAEMRDEINQLVDRQPEDVAALLRGWLVER